MNHRVQLEIRLQVHGFFRTVSNIVTKFGEWVRAVCTQARLFPSPITVPDPWHLAVSRNSASADKRILSYASG